MSQFGGWGSPGADSEMRLGARRLRHEPWVSTPARLADKPISFHHDERIPPGYPGVISHLVGIDDRPGIDPALFRYLSLPAAPFCAGAYRYGVGRQPDAGDPL